MTDSFEKRLDFSGDIDGVVQRTVQAYELGELVGHNLITVGFQDYNIHAQTTSGEYLLKVFSKSRDENNTKRYVDIIEAVLAGGVQHPLLMRDNEGQAHHVDKESGLRMAVMEFVKGKTFFDMDRAPTDAELAAIAEEAVKINKIDFTPDYLFDSWALINNQWMYDQVEPFMDDEGKELTKKVLELYKKLPVAELPKAFVHGDIIKTNTLLGDDGKIYIIDFAVSNIYPRVQEIAVMAANLTFDGKTTLQDRLEKVRIAYEQAGGELTPIERSSLYDFALAATAMEYMGSYYEKHISGETSEEIDYWAKLGREGLREALA